MKKNIVFRVTTLLAVLVLLFGAAGALPVQAAPAAMVEEAQASRFAQALNTAGEGQPALPIGFYATAVTAGGYHTCALTGSGGVKCWGDNGYGQLGNATTDVSYVPVQVSGLESGVSAIAAGEDHTCALTVGGGVKCWGNNGSGQLGNGTTVVSNVPVPVSGLESGVSAIAASENHTCALMTAGGVQCWGFNLYGQLGDDSITNRTAPVPVSGLASAVSAISVGGNNTCALTTSGAVKCWGSNDVGQLGNGTTTDSAVPVPVNGLASGVNAIAVGVNHTCVLTTTGGVKCWGDNSSGQLGDNSTTQRNTPVQVSGMESDMGAIALGVNHTCALTPTGGMTCWGNNSFGQLGNDAIDSNSLTPTPVSGLASGLSAIATGAFHTCALTTSAEVKCWGNNTLGQLGNGTKNNSPFPTPADVVGLAGGVSAISGGQADTCALMAGGGVKCWGANVVGQLGDGTSTDRAIPVDVLVAEGGPALSGVSAISVGATHTCALTAAAGVKCWGDNSLLQLGLGRLNDIFSNIPLDVLNLTDVVSVSAGGFHTCALTKTGGVKCWGHNAYGQLGDGNLEPRNTPVDVLDATGEAALSNVSAISAGLSHTCVLTTVGGVQCWGRNTFGQLGDGNSGTYSPNPVQVSGLESGVSAISAAESHTCALLTTGGVKCWGGNSNGQLGVGTTTNSATPVDVLVEPEGSALGEVSAISAGYLHTCVLTNASGVMCWGGNSHGQLGVDPGLYSTTPLLVSGLEYGLSAISAGENHTCAVTSASGVKCLGSNSHGQLGDNNPGVDSPTPVQVSGLLSLSFPTLLLVTQPAIYGQTVSLIARVTSAVQIPSGMVQFTIDGVSGPPVAMLDGSATSLDYTDLALGAHLVQASYTGDDNHFASVSVGQVQIVRPEAASPTTVAASDATASAVNLHGTISGGGYSTTVTFQYGQDINYGSSVAAAESPLTGDPDTAVSAAITGLTANTTYHYRVVADNGGGLANGEDMDFTTPFAPPTATTSAPTGISTTTATLKGLVNANGSSTDVTFEYGPTTSYGKTVDATPPTLSDSTATAVSAALTGLTSSTIYHFRVKAVSDGGTTNSAERTFTTATSAPTAVTSAATYVNATTAILRGTVNANGSSTTVIFEYGTTLSYGQTKAATPGPLVTRTNTAVSAALAGLAPSTTYHFRVKAINGGGSLTVTGADMTFTTIAAPAATTSPASVVSATSATLNGSVNANGSSTVVTFEYGPTTGYGQTKAATPGTLINRTSTAVSAALTGLAPSTTYHFRVKAVNSVNTTYGADKTFTTLTSAPTATTSAATNISVSTAILHGSVNANGRPTLATFEYGPTASYGLSQPAIPNSLNGSTTTAVRLNLAGLLPAMTYHFRVKAVNVLGTTYGADTTFSTAAIAPAGTTGAAYGIGTTAASLRGVANANGSSSTITFEYGLSTSYGSIAAANPGTLTNRTATAVIAAISGLLPSRIYHFRVKAVNSAGTATGHDMIFMTLPMAERIVNGGFEIYSSSIAKTPASWAATNFSGLDGRDINVKKLGLSSLRIGGENSKTKFLTQAIALIGMPNTAFMLSFWARGSNIPEAGLCRLDVMIYSNATLLVTKTLACKTGTYSTFTQASLPTFKTTTAFNRLVIRITYTKSTGTIWLDGVSLMK